MIIKNKIIACLNKDFREYKSFEEISDLKSFIQINDPFTVDCIIDTTVSPSSYKLKLLTELDSLKIPIYSEMTVNEPYKALLNIKNLNGVFSLAFLQSKSTFFECFIKKLEFDNSTDIFKEYFKGFNLEPFFMPEPELGFYGARIISMIINEAYFALDEKIASPDDIDNATLYGVNYPFSPIKFSKEIGVVKIFWLLEELKAFSGDERYNPAKSLKLKALEELQKI
jgi:3-hydroxybutyryl-CoA dehydrogenase